MSAPEYREYEITFSAHDMTWKHYVYGTREDAEDHAIRACYEPSTRYTIKLAPPVAERTSVS